jgi:diaminopimelate epimerase
MNDADKINFYKMNGLGNDIVVVDMRNRQVRSISPSAVLSHLSAAAKFDQLMIVHPSRTIGTLNFVEILNSDGSIAHACGNGMRCVGKLLATKLVSGGESINTNFQLETIVGIMSVSVLDDGLISVDMGAPREVRVSEDAIDDPVLHSPSFVSMGNPHAIFWVDNDVWQFELDRFGPVFEHHPIFPDRANISIAYISSTNDTESETIYLRTWERGAGLTLACGSAACAAAVAAASSNRTGRNVSVIVPSGGVLRIEWREEDDHVIMIGPAEFEFSGQFAPDLTESTSS